MSRRYDWKPDVADHRDRMYAGHLSVTKTLPPKVAIIGKGNKIEDQGDLGSCTGNASTSMVEIIAGTPQLSRLMAYYNGRFIMNTVSVDSGCTIRDVIKGFANTGVCTEALWPYTISKFKTKPNVAAMNDAKTLISRIKEYQRVPNLLAMKTALAEGRPVTFGFSVPEYFESEEVAVKGWLRMPTMQDAMIGGHAVVAVGYDNTAPQPFIWVRNSWGTGWGLDGYFKMDQRWFTDPSRLADDMWTITAVKPPNVVKPIKK